MREPGIAMVPWVTATLASSLSGTQGGDSGRQEILLNGDRLGSPIGISTTIIGALIGYYWNPLVAVALFLALPVFYYVLSDGLERTPKPQRVAPLR